MEEIQPRVLPGSPGRPEDGVKWMISDEGWPGEVPGCCSSEIASHLGAGHSSWVLRLCSLSAGGLWRAESEFAFIR